MTEVHQSRLSSESYSEVPIRAPLSFDEFVGEKYRAIRNVVATEVHRVAVDGLDENDVMQEVLIRLWKNFDKLDQNKKVEGWITIVSRNIVLDLIRMKSKRVSTTSLDGFEDPATAEWLVEHAATSRHPTLESERKRDYSYEFLQFASEALSNTTDSLDLLLAVNDGWSIKECAERFGKKEGTIKSQVHYAKKILLKQGETLVENSTADISLSPDIKFS